MTTRSKGAATTAPDEHVTPGDERGHWSEMRLRVVGGTAQVLAIGGTWTTAPLRILARHYPADSATWRWLAERGVRRPRVGGETQPEVERSARQVKLRLRPEADRALEALASSWGTTRSEVVSRLVLEAVASGCYR